MDRNYIVSELIQELSRLPKHYAVLLCADFSTIGGSPWTWTFRIELDNDNQVVRIQTNEMT